MSNKKKDKLLLNLLEGERHRHRVAMVTDEGTFNQHEPNSNMARMFVVMLLNLGHPTTDMRGPPAVAATIVIGGGSVPDGAADRAGQPEDRGDQAPP